MIQPQGLVIIHVDGLSYGNLQKALAQGRMPFVQHLIDQESYEPHAYRCGIPSTTPFAQAGILYGDNCEIPSFRWWDKESGLLVAFGAHSSFKHVAHKYFQHSEPLIQGGACIAACYPAGSADNLGIAYHSLQDSIQQRPELARDMVTVWVRNPLNLADWATRGFIQIWKANLQYWRARLNGKSAAQRYVLSDLGEEIFLHQLTRMAVIDAMERDFPIMYAGFYAYDETAHAYGPSSDYSMHILRHIDHTLQRIGAKRNAENRPHHKSKRDYEVVILSDHGSIDTTPFRQAYGKHLAEFIFEWLPTYIVSEHPGKPFKPEGAIDGHIDLTFSGGLGHLYFRELAGRLDCSVIEARFPSLLERMARMPGMGFVLLREGNTNIIATQDRRMSFQAGERLNQATSDFLEQFDEPEVLARQLDKLNSFRHSGDLILFGAFVDGKQINFEHQTGGHGSVGGEQLHPFVLAKREWGFDTTNVSSASELYPLLKNLRDTLVPATNF